MILHLINKNNIPKILLLNLPQTQLILNIHLHHLIIKSIINLKISTISINYIQIYDITKLIYLTFVGATKEGVEFVDVFGL